MNIKSENLCKKLLLNNKQYLIILICSCMISTANSSSSALASDRIFHRRQHNNNDVENSGASSFSTIPEDTSRIKHVDGFHSAFISYFDESLNTYRNKSEVGTYGEGHVGPVWGYVYHIVSKYDKNDHTGCELPLSTTQSEISELPPNKPWIALIKRGKCNFEDKVNNAHKSNAAGVLVYDDRDKDHLDRMKLLNTERNISAVFTYKWKGEEIARLIDSGSRVRLNITVGPPQTLKPFPTINRTSVLFVSISFIVLMIISLTWLVFYYVQRFRYIHAKDKLSRQLCNAAKKALSKIPTKNIKPNDKEIEGDGECCAVCIEPYKISDIIRILPCRHEFHKYCIDPWLLEHRTCPMCKMDILKHYGFVFTGSQESILHVDIEEAVPVDNQQSFEGPSNDNIMSRMQSERHHSSRANSRNSERSSRASTPDELTPSLEEESHEQDVIAYTDNNRRDKRMCINCMVATIATENEIQNLKDEYPSQSSNKITSSTTSPSTVVSTTQSDNTAENDDQDEDDDVPSSSTTSPSNSNQNTSQKSVDIKNLELE
ncbi:protein goliath-like isoform X2 [Chrysoperla carnea]|uniref:protein goliath-like isoform X2 n=1 Tax=Chrysoperla carnea TaxID=189513 RepID=UPI001D061EA6|nr:protein goliath-like isoform X2 [Chrysoperla carnea]